MGGGSMVRILAAIAVIVMLAGCASKGTSPRNDGSGDRARAEGYLYQTTTHAAAAGLVIVDGPDHAPSGATALAGATVSAQTHDNHNVASVTTDGDGHFLFDDLPAGFLALEFRSAGGTGSPDTTLDLTAIAGSTIPVGATFATDRITAAQHALPGLPCEAILLGTMQPLPAGTEVHQSFSDVLGVEASHTTAGSEWLFVVDSIVNAGFTHPVQYIFVDAATNTVTSRVYAQSMPVVGAAELWGSDLAYAYYDGIEWSQINELDDITVTAVEFGPEVIQYEPCSEEKTSSPSTEIPQSLRKELETTAPEDIFTFAFCGGNRSDFFADFLHIQKFFAQYAPALNRRQVATPFENSSTVNTVYHDEFEAQKQQILERLDAGGDPLLVVHITSHGTEDGVIAAEFSDGRAFGLDAEYYELETAHACRIRLLVGACFSERFIENVKARFQSLPLNQRADFVSYAAASADEYSYGATSFQEALSFGLIKSGGLFLNEALPLMTIEGNELVGLRRANGELQPELAELSGVTGRQSQHPALAVLAGDPDWCAGGVLPPLIEVLGPPHEATVTGDEPECFDSVGTFGLRNGDQFTISWEWSSNTGYLDLDVSGGELSPAESLGLKLYYNCEAETSFTDNFTFSGTRLDGTRTGTASFTIQVTIDPGFKTQLFDIAPPSPFGTNTTNVWHPIPLGDKVDSTRLALAESGDPIPANPWPGCGQISFSVDYEGPQPGNPGYYGVELKTTNFTSQPCSEGNAIPCRYTVWYSPQ